MKNQVRRMTIGMSEDMNKKIRLAAARASLTMSDWIKDRLTVFIEKEGK